MASSLVTVAAWVSPKIKNIARMKDNMATTQDEARESRIPTGHANHDVRL
jgi:hypothetical protein